MTDKKKKDKKPPLLTRRDVLKIGGITAAAAAFTQLVNPGKLEADTIQLIGKDSHEDSGASSEFKWCMVIDLDECIGCSYCMYACQAVNDVPDDDMRWNVVFAERTFDGIDFTMSRPCFHCEDAPCVSVCPVEATWKREDGIVAMDYDRCIGCRYCEVACPYDVRRFNWKLSEEENEYQPVWGIAEVERRPRGVVEKCTFCVQRIDRGIELGLTPGIDRIATPACVNICPVNARVFGNHNDPESPISKFIEKNNTFLLHEEWGTTPKVHYVRPKKKES